MRHEEHSMTGEQSLIMIGVIVLGIIVFSPMIIALWKWAF